MPQTTHSPYTLLAQTRCTCLRLVQTPTGLLLQRFSLGESVQIELNTAETHALLTALPTPVLLEALAERGLTLDDLPQGAREASEDNPFFALDDRAPCEER